MDRLRSAHKCLDEQLHKKNAVTDVLAKIEDKTKVSRLNIVLGLVAILVLYLIFGYGSSFLATFIGFIYPAYKSIKALETQDKSDDTKWLTYWVVFAAVSVVEALTDIFFFWIPLYSLLKCAVFVFMMMPMNPNGSLLIYEHLIRPNVLRHEKQIDDALDRAADLASDFSEGAKKAALSAAADHFSSKED